MHGTRPRSSYSGSTGTPYLNRATGFQVGLGPSPPDLQSAGCQERLGGVDRVAAEMKDRCGEHRIGAGLEPLGQVGELADPAGRDDRDTHRAGDGADELEVVPEAGAIAVHAGDEELAGAELDDLPAPGARIEPFGD